MSDSRNQPVPMTTILSDIVSLLQTLPSISDNQSRQAFIHSARLDDRLFKQIQFGGSIAQFFENLVPTLADYGVQEDGRDPLAAVLEAAKERVGPEKQAVCDQLIQKLYAAGRPNPALCRDQEARQQTERAHIAQLQKQLPARIKELKPIYVRLVSWLKRIRNEGCTGEDDVLLDILQQFLENTLTADEFIDLWQTSVSAPVEVEKINYHALAQRLEQGNIIPVLGAEVHHLSGLPFPSERDLVHTLAKGVQYEPFQGPLSMISQYYEMTEYGRGTLVQTVRQTVEPKPELHYSHPLYTLLSTIPAPLLILSGCYDDLLERYFTDAGKPYVVISHLRLDAGFNKLVIKYWDRPEPEEPCLPEELSPLKLLDDYSMVYKVRGCFGLSLADLGGAMDSLMLSEEDYFAFARQAETLIPGYLATRMGRGSLMFFGSTLHDWQDRLVVNAILEKKRAARGLSYAVQEAPTQYERAYWKSHGVELYQMNLNRFLERIREFL